MLVFCFFTEIQIVLKLLKSVKLDETDLEHKNKVKKYFIKDVFNRFVDRYFTFSFVIWNLTISCKFDHFWLMSDSVYLFIS